MKVAHDPRTDTLSVVFRDDATVTESDEDKPGVTVEILDASKRLTDARRVDFQTIG